VSIDRQLSAASSGRSYATARASLKTHFNVQHMVSAALFARKALEIETTHEQDLVSGEPYYAHRGYVTGAVLSAVASLEATINELFIDAQHGDPNTFKGADRMIPRLFAEYWDEIEGARILTKYQMALILARKGKFDRGGSPYQEVDSLIQLRNALVHYKPEWDTDQNAHRRIQERIESYRFELNPFTGPNDAFFPKKCLGHGCAEWAVNSGVAFINEFFDRLGLATIFAGERQDREELQELLCTR
jgi:hypothetical protein